MFAGLQNDASTGAVARAKFTRPAAANEGTSFRDFAIAIPPAFHSLRQGREYT